MKLQARHEQDVTLCHYCDTPTHDLDYCPGCDRHLRPSRQKRHEKDAAEFMAQSPARRLALGLAALADYDYDTDRYEEEA